MSKVHAMTLEFKHLCGARGPVSIVNGRKNDRLAKLITCKTCRRRWRKMVRS